MTSFKYCPDCGSKSIAADYIKYFLCEQCGYKYFMNAATATSVIIEYDDKILFTVRANEPGKGKLDLPGGFVDSAESAEQALERELMEELSLIIDMPVYLCSFPNVYPYENVTYHTVDLFYVKKLDHDPILKPADDVADIKWIKKNEIPFDEIAFPSVRFALKHYLEISD